MAENKTLDLTSKTVMAKAQTSEAAVTFGILSPSGASSSWAIQRYVPLIDLVVKPDTSKIRERPKSVMLASCWSFTRIFDWKQQAGELGQIR